MSDITIQNFEADLIQASMQQPMLLDIWAPWCGPCRTLGPLLERVEAAYGGRFKLAKLNSDDQPEIAAQLSQAFGVRSIPFCVLFKEGQPVDGFVGAVPEAQIREFLDRHVAGAEVLEAAEDTAEAEAEALAADGDVDAALAKLQQALVIDPANHTARNDYVKLLIETGAIAQARQAWLPVAAKALVDARIAALGLWLDACEKAPAARTPQQLAAAIEANRRDFDARYELAQGLLAGGQFTAAMDALLEIVMRDKVWNGELARKTYVAILEILTKPAPKPAAGETAKGALELTGRTVVAAGDPVVDQYRRKLSMALF
jgi:putative thioredoxin